MNRKAAQTHLECFGRTIQRPNDQWQYFKGLSPTQLAVCASFGFPYRVRSAFHPALGDWFFKRVDEHIELMEALLERN